MTKRKIEPCIFCGKVPRTIVVGTVECVNNRCMVIINAFDANAFFERPLTISEWNRAMRRARRRAVR